VGHCQLAAHQFFPESQQREIVGLKNLSHTTAQGAEEDCFQVVAPMAVKTANNI